MRKKEVSTHNDIPDSISLSEFKRLKSENRRLKREIQILKQEFETANGDRAKHHRKSRFHNMHKKCADNEYLFSRKNYISYVYSHLKRTSFFHFYSRIVSYLRRYAIFTTTLKIASLIFVFIETTALFIISTSAFIISVILTLVFSHIFTVLTVFARHRANENNIARVREKNVTVLFPTKHRAFDEDSYFSGLVRELAQKENALVVIVSPFLIKSTGICEKKKPYYTCREDGKSILIVRRSYYFTLKNKIISKYAASITEIY